MERERTAARLEQAKVEEAVRGNGQEEVGQKTDPIGQRVKQKAAHGAQIEALVEITRRQGEQMRAAILEGLEDSAMTNRHLPALQVTLVLQGHCSGGRHGCPGTSSPAPRSGACRCTSARCESAMSRPRTSRGAGFSEMGIEARSGATAVCRCTRSRQAASLQGGAFTPPEWMVELGQSVVARARRRCPGARDESGFARDTIEVPLSRASDAPRPASSR